MSASGVVVSLGVWGEVLRCCEGSAGVGCGVRYVEVVGYGEG